MRETIMACFQRFEEEGKLIGRRLAGYGELEFELCRCVAAVTNDLDAAIRAMFRIRGEAKRIKAADTLAKAALVNAGLATPYCAAIGDMDWYRGIRNQYAHCHWYDTPRKACASLIWRV